MAQTEAEVSGPSPRNLQRYAREHLHLQSYLEAPGDGRQYPRIPAQHLLWSLLLTRVLRENSFHAAEALVHSPAARAAGLPGEFGDDALAYFTERLDPESTRQALVQLAQHCKHNKTFDETRFIGLAIDGTGAGRSEDYGCSLCHARTNADGTVRDYLHHFCLLSIVGTGLSLPLDLEPYGPGDNEKDAGRRVLARAVGKLGKRFADYVVVDAGFNGAPFLHAVTETGLNVIARLKGNLPELFSAAQARFANQPPHVEFQDGRDWVQAWDADDFGPWEGLRWTAVRVLRYRQHKPDGTVVEAYWLTDFATKKVGTRSLYRLAKSRWEVENQGFNDGKNRYGMEHICHHEQNSLLMMWLLTILAMAMERLYRLRYLHRGKHPVRTPVELLRALRLNLALQLADDSS